MLNCQQKDEEYVKMYSLSFISQKKINDYPNEKQNWFGQTPLSCSVYLFLRIF